jgi:hypothetical protein
VIYVKGVNMMILIIMLALITLIIVAAVWGPMILKAFGWGQQIGGTAALDLPSVFS